MDCKALDWIEQQASKNFEAGMKARADLNREVHVTVSFVAVAMAASFSAGLRLWYQDSNRFHGGMLLLISVYLSSVLVYTVRNCLRVGPVWPQANEPENLIESLGQQSLELVREAELIGLQRRIKKNDQRSWEIGRSLNQVRMFVAAIPGVYLGIVVARWVICP